MGPDLKVKFYFRGRHTGHAGFRRVCGFKHSLWSWTCSPGIRSHYCWRKDQPLSPGLFHGFNLSSCNHNMAVLYFPFNSGFACVQFPANCWASSLPGTMGELCRLSHEAFCTEAHSSLCWLPLSIGAPHLGRGADAGGAPAEEPGGAAATPGTGTG